MLAFELGAIRFLDVDIAVLERDRDFFTVLEQLAEVLGADLDAFEPIVEGVVGFGGHRMTPVQRAPQAGENARSYPARLAGW